MVLSCYNAQKCSAFAYRVARCPEAAGIPRAVDMPKLGTDSKEASGNLKRINTVGSYTEAMTTGKGRLQYVTNC